MESEKPDSINVSRKRKVMEVLWGDGHQSVYPFRLLRAACPCAFCRGGHEEMSSEPPENVFATDLPDSPATSLVDVELAGGYGAILYWEDGHHDGIFTWHYLRALCPCENCRAKNTSEH